ncbi:unnamed protein product [Cuscuta epithymum]|uniref:OCRE domain-containing protein n=1 Tax=Cuscuta epithymum TaxID=186058 RepID=A0AAV0FXS2_9ASTE|nr:unnamed protein product [Cuscuta epithymum]
MEGGPSRSRKRSFKDSVDDGSENPSGEKKLRFPKGKKLKHGDYVENRNEELPSGFNPRVAARERAMRRNKITAELLEEEEESRGLIPNIALAEEIYEEDEVFIDDGIPIEPFNLAKEREEGYFDANGNYVEYAHERDVKDAWLDSIDVHPKAAGKAKAATSEDEAHDLTSEELGKMKRRIADVLDPGETVLKALRRLKGTSKNKEKMTMEKKQLFDQLTEDAMKLMENGDYNVYEERQESFQREAEGYERLTQAKALGTSMELKNSTSSSVFDDDFIPTEGPSNANASTFVGNSEDDSYDMFTEDDGAPLTTTNNASNEGGQENDYVYDESSGYYYSVNLGYYYDPSSGLYCNAASGKWYSYDEETGKYEEIPQAETNMS